MADSIHVRVSDIDRESIRKVQKIMRAKGFPEPTMTEAVRYALSEYAKIGGKK
jgi:hypothetical protein